MVISLLLAASTLTHLHSAFRRKPGSPREGMDPFYMRIRIVLFAALALVLLGDPNGTPQTRILGVFSVWYVIFYGILLGLRARRRPRRE
uniref:Uncharacterized protein n=1 Tax=Marseillevirus LCMAC103 TaxID=2506604 RepID=A0A481YVM9_9VIRU|nr:MAG: hypothetical protein LCMAC103_01830 [Marseillevirus LCMAC103]